MVEIGALDCGSNSTRLLISTVENGTLENLYKEHQVTRLSDSIDKTGRISDDSKKRFFKVLRKYMRKIEEYEVQEVFCIGTAVFRNSKNSDEIIDEVKKRFNLDIKIISGEEEGLLTSLGVQSSFKNLQNYLIVDIGGQSTELISDIENKLDIQSEDIGVVSMSENYFTENPISIDKEKNATNYFNDIFHDKDYAHRQLIGVSGTFTSLGSIYLNQKKYDENEIDKVIISYDSVKNIYEDLKTLSVPKIISKYPSLDPKRAVTITSGLFLVINLLKKYKITQLKVSKSDILEGLILKYF
jgi:exopolyphosphatase/guanosine-5'-triphosphate,3'-diphosphate pyrophosphatase